MSYFNDLHAIRSRSGVGLATLAAAILIAGCGSSSSKKAGEALKNSSSSASTPTVVTPTSAETTPTSGPLSQEPKVTPPSGPVPSKLVIKEIITGTGPEAKPGAAVTINYVVAFYKSGEVFEGSWKRNQPFKFVLGNSILAAWNEGVAGMKVGGRRELISPARLAWGSQGRPPLVPPNAPVVFVVDLLGTSSTGL